MGVQFPLEAHWAYGSTAEYCIRIAGIRVQFSVGPPRNNSLRKLNAVGSFKTKIHYVSPMKDEMVDVVDENNKTLYKTSKKEAHDKGLLHRCVISEIINLKDEWLLFVPSEHKQDKHQYVSPIGGHVQAGESLEDALKREAFEEVGLEDYKFKFIGRGIYNRFVIGRRENHYFNLFEIYSDDKVVLSDETKDFKYFTKEEIKRLMKTDPKIFGGAFHFVYKNIYKKFKE